jgi:hypothetical protein
MDSSLQSLATVLVVFGAATAAFGSQFLPREDGTPQAAAAAALSPASASASASAQDKGRRRCDTCGTVEAIRRVEAAGDLPQAYEFTVRLRDGSSRVSRADSASNWRAGDRVMLIGGARSSAH